MFHRDFFFLTVGKIKSPSITFKNLITPSMAIFGYGPTFNYALLLLCIMCCIIAHLHTILSWSRGHSNYFDFFFYNFWFSVLHIFFKHFIIDSYIVLNIIPKHWILSFMFLHVSLILWVVLPFQHSGQFFLSLTQENNVSNQQKIYIMLPTKICFYAFLVKR